MSSVKLCEQPRGCQGDMYSLWLLVASLPEIFDTHCARLLDRNDQASTCGLDSQELLMLQCFMNLEGKV